MVRLVSAYVYPARFIRNLDSTADTIFIPRLPPDSRLSPRSGHPSLPHLHIDTEAWSVLISTHEKLTGIGLRVSHDLHFLTCLTPIRWHRAPAPRRAPGTFVLYL